MSGEIDLKHLRRQSEVQIAEYKELVEQLRADYEQQERTLQKAKNTVTDLQLQVKDLKQLKNTLED